MIITALNESPKDRRVAISPAAVKHYVKLGLQVACERQAGQASGFHDLSYETAGAIMGLKHELLPKTQVLLAVNAPSLEDLALLPAQASVICSIDNNAADPIVQLACRHPLSLFSMNQVPRISRAQGMDSLSSQANLAGYRAVLEAVGHYSRAVPMMMTAAGMIQPAKVLILGAGVAGLQAIATAKRLGAVVYAFDVRKAAKEQVESLGAEFIEVQEEAIGLEANLETASGYAREMSKEYQALQAALIHKYAQMADIVISTALIPGKPAPILLKAATVKAMKPGSVIVDMATARGGNCELSQDNAIVDVEGITIIGNSNLAAQIPATASELYSQNIVNLMRLLVKGPDEIFYDPQDDIIQGALLCYEGRYLPFQKTVEA